MRIARTHALVAAAAVLAACRPGFDGGPDLGPLAEVETVGVRLAQESRPAIAGAENGRCRVDVRLRAGHLVLAFGWRAPAADAGGSGTTARVRFEGRDGKRQVLAQTPLPPPRGGPEGWLESVLPIPDEIVGRAGELVFENGGAGTGGAFFTALPEAIAARGERPNVLLVSIDTLRADRLGIYGHHRPTSPAIDALARGGTLFENALAQSSWTLPSHYSMFTSLYPSAHGVNPDRWLFAGIHGAHETFRIRGSGRERTLAERLRSQGYFTAAITENGWVHSRFGFDQGFASFVDHGIHRLGNGTWRLALQWLASHRELPFFLFLHTYEPHQPYTQPPPYDTLFVDPGHRGYALSGTPVPMAILERFHQRVFPPMPADVEAFGGLYDGAVRYVDEFIAALLEALRDHGLERDTLLLLTSDHGEALFEHGNFGHGGTLYDEVMRIPFILWGPGRVPAGKAVGAPVALLDVLPTLVELTGGEVEDGLQGESLVPLLDGGAASLGGRVLFAESYAEESVPITSVWQGGDKVIFYGAELERAELFDLARDPGEVDDLAARQPDKVARLRQLVRAWQEENRRILDELGEAQVGIDAETEERLRALGYL